MPTPAVATWLERLVHGDVEGLAAELAPQVTIDDPLAGRVVGGGPHARPYLEDRAAWLARHGARVEPIRTTVCGSDAAGEWILHLRALGEGRQLPVCVVSSADASGRLHAVRVYHSTWPLERTHRVRPRLLPARPLLLTRPLDAYQRALAQGDVAGLLACFEANAAAREPSGAPWIHRGRDGLARFYGAILADGGMVLEPGNAIDDGVACVLEYTAVRWGRAALPPQAGVAVYERGAGGLLAATRIYDDLDRPRVDRREETWPMGAPP